MSRENSCGCIFSASDVEPRTSAKRSDSSTSAPPGRLSIDRKHARHRRRFSCDGPNPNGLTMTLPGGLERGEAELAARAPGDLPHHGAEELERAQVAVQDRAPGLLHLGIDVVLVVVLRLEGRLAHVDIL